MSKNNNLIIEIQDLIKHIETNYQEGVDFQIPYWSLKGGPGQAGAIHHLSPRLKSFLRKKFDFPVGINDYLDYSKTDLSGNNYYYRLDGEHGKGEFEGLYFRHSNKSLEQEQPKNCEVCSKLTTEEEGRMWQWNEKTVGKEFGQESKVIGYFHPECAKKYFAEKEQPNQNNTHLKEKILRNLDKISLDSVGYLANAKLLKNWNNLDNYTKGEFFVMERSEEGLYKIEDNNGEEINCEAIFRWPNWESAREDYQEIGQAIVAKIKNNLTDWKIIKEEGKKGLKWKVAQNKKTGLKHYQPFFLTTPSFLLEEKVKIWAEIEALINGSSLSVNSQLTQTDKTQLLQYFLTYHITKITLDNGKLVVEYDNSQKGQKVDNLELEKYKSLIQNLPNHEISLSYLQKDKQDKGNPTKNPKDNKLILGLALGAGAVALIGVVVYFWNCKGKRT